jgi:peroxiredoxin
MKTKLGLEFSISFIGILIFFGCNRVPQTPLEELSSIGEQMKQNQQVAYRYQIDLYRSYADDTIRNEGIIYFESNLADTAIGFNFDQESEYYSSFYNGAYLINMIQQDSFAYKKPLCDYKDGHMTGYPYLELSYAAIQNFLTDSLFTTKTDSIVRVDTIVDNAKCYSYTFWTDSRIVDTYKLPRHFGRKKINLVVSLQDNLPVRYSQYQPIQKGEYHYTEASFKNYSFKKRFPKHQFSIENVPEYYSWDKLKAFYQTLELQTDAPNWELPLVSGSNVSLSDLRGKFLLLDFWFIGCGACVESIPTLNALQEKFGKSNFEVVGINCYSNNVEKIKAYCIERNMQYRNVWNGESICDNYLIRAAPVFYLIDQEGKVAYTQIGHDDKKLVSNVEGILKQAL